MKVSLTDAGKRFNRDWIFRHLNYEFESGRSYAITGPNGSGKSTLLQILSGSMQLSEGKIEFGRGSADDKCRHAGREHRPPEAGVDSEKIYRHVAFCAPYLEVVEEMTLAEFLNFHQGFKPFLPGMTTEKIISMVELEKATHKQIRYYSSGMKQRVKLAQAIFSDVPVILLDEPCTNLDAAGVFLYHRLMHEYGKNRLVVVSSNDEAEYSFCERRLNISDYKKQLPLAGN